MKAQIVSFHCILRDKLGRVLSTSFNSEVSNFIEGGGEAATLRGLVAGLQDVKEGEKRRIFVPADQAYGLYDPKLVVDGLDRNHPLAGQDLIFEVEVTAAREATEEDLSEPVIVRAEGYLH